jgi:hypothetical protein
MESNSDCFGEYLFTCIVFPVLVIGMKRMRERFEEGVAACKVRRVLGRRRNIHRMRQGVIEELRRIDADTFQRMFRMPFATFFQLDRCVGVIMRRRKHWTEHSDQMARRSSGSAVETTLLFA